MLDKLKDVEEKYNTLTERIMDPELTSDISEFQKVMKEHSD